MPEAGATFHFPSVSSYETYRVTIQYPNLEHLTAGELEIIAEAVRDVIRAKTSDTDYRIGMIQRHEFEDVTPV